MAKKKTDSTAEPQKFKVGETVIILRCHLWAGAVGEVVSFANGMHRIRIPAKEPTEIHQYYHADVPGSMLESYI